MKGELKSKLTVIILAVLELILCYIVSKLINLPWYVLGLVYIIPYLTVGFETVKEAAESIIHGAVLDENFLMTAATAGAFVLRDYPEAVFVMLFYQIGEFFEELAQEKSRKSIADLMDICPETATVIREGQETTVKPDSIKIGETIVIKPGEKISVDGKIIKGETEINTVALTGEAMPVYAQKGDRVISGCINISGLIFVKAEKEFGESTAAKILELVENADSVKAKSEKFITKFAKIYTPIVVILAVLIAVVPILFGGIWSEWISRGIKLLVVSCPCAPVVSIPLAYFAGIGKASRQGVLIKGSEYLEKLAIADTVIMDKTGTLTEGEFSVKKVLGREDTLKIGASLECHTTHPIGKSILKAQGEDLFKVDNIKEYSGKGIVAEFNGKKYFAGNDKLLKELNVAPFDDENEGTKVYIGENDKCIGVIILEDKVRENAQKAIIELKKMNIKIAMLTGDRVSTAKDVANKLKIDMYVAELLPQDKVKVFDKITENSACDVFIGDGINDAPVLRKADVGVAMGVFGSDVAIEAADIVLMNDDLNRIADAVKTAKETNKIAKENIVISIIVKTAILIFCILNGATLGMAVFADVGVLMLTIFNSMRLMTDD